MGVSLFQRSRRVVIWGLVFGSGFAINRRDMTPKPDELDIHSEAFLHRLMRRQLRLSITCAATFLVALLGLPLLNYFAPEMMAKRVAGFTLTWLLLGVLFFPLVWVIAFYFIRRSMALEDEETRRVKGS
jgi:uncharacterized membrane protein (DUF485 family)